MDFDLELVGRFGNVLESLEKEVLAAGSAAPRLLSVAFSDLMPPFRNVLFSQAVIIPASAVLTFKTAKRASLRLRQTDKGSGLAACK